MARRAGRDPEETKQAILAAAEQVFSVHGFAGTAMSEIAKEADVTKSLIHHHFGSKAKLWQAIKVSLFQQFEAEATGILDLPGTAEEFARSVFVAYFTFLNQNPGFVRLMWWTQAEHGASQHPDRDEPVNKTIRNLARRGISRIKQGQESGEFRDDVEAEHIFASWLALLRHWFVARQDFPAKKNAKETSDRDDAYMQAALTIFIDGVLAKKRAT